VTKYIQAKLDTVCGIPDNI